MKKDIIEFINRRFPEESNWMNGNCFYFAQILASRFHGEIIYDPIDGHFLFLASDDQLYDWTGLRIYEKGRRRKMVVWRDYMNKDPLHFQHIWRDCVK